MQTGDAAFDREWYVESGTSDFVRTMFAAADKRDAVRKLGSLGFAQIQLSPSPPTGGSGSIAPTGAPRATLGGWLTATLFNPDKSVLADAGRVRKAVPALGAVKCAWWLK